MSDKKNGNKNGKKKNKNQNKKIIFIILILIFVIIAILIFSKSNINKKDNNAISNLETLNNDNLDKGKTKLQISSEKIEEKEKVIKDLNDQIDKLQKSLGEIEIIYSEEMTATSNNKISEKTKNNNSEKENIEKEISEKQEKLNIEINTLNKLYEEYNLIMREYSTGVPDEE